MKLLLENWRQFVEESNYITIDESDPSTFLLESLEEMQDLKEESSDPEVLSVEDLKQLKPEVIQAAYKNLHVKETTASQSDRKEAMEVLLKDQEEEIDWTGTSNVWVPSKDVPNDGIIGQFMNNVKGFINSFFGADFEVYNRNSKELSSLGKEIQNLFRAEFTPLEREIIRSIFMFTGQSVPTVRDPSEFNPRKTKIVSYVNDGIRDDFLPTKATYEKAKIILQALQDTPLTNKSTVFRGLAVPVSNLGGFTPLSGYKKGAIINVGNIVSFSVSSSVAMDFAQNSWSKNTIGGKSKLLWRGFPVILIIPKGKLKRGASIDEFSHFEGAEKEILASGNFVITNIGYQRDEGKVRKGFRDFKSVYSEIIERNPKFSFKNYADEYFITVFLEQEEITKES